MYKSKINVWFCVYADYEEINKIFLKFRNTNHIKINNNE